jgi:hypothetical protein
MYNICNIYIMELIEGIVWVLAGFVPSLIALEVIGWKLASKKRTKPAQEVKMPQWTV